MYKINSRKYNEKLYKTTSDMRLYNLLFYKIIWINISLKQGQDHDCLEGWAKTENSLNKIIELGYSLNRPGVGLPLNWCILFLIDLTNKNLQIYYFYTIIS